MQAEPGTMLPKHRDVFYIPYALGARRIVLVPGDSLRSRYGCPFSFPRLSGKPRSTTSHLWKIAQVSVVPSRPSLNPSRSSTETGATPRELSTSRRAILSLASRIRDNDATNAHAHDEAGENLSDDAKKASATFGDAVSKSSTGRRRQPGNLWGHIPSDHAAEE